MSSAVTSSMAANGSRSPGPDLSTFRSIDSPEQERRQPPSPGIFKRPEKPARPNAKEPGPDLSCFQECLPEVEKKGRTRKVLSVSIANDPTATGEPTSGGMQRKLSIGSQMWSWGRNSPPSSREGSLRGGSLFGSLSSSREGSLRGGGLFAGLTKSRENSLRGGNNFGGGDTEMKRNSSLSNLWAWANRSPPQSRENSMHGGSAFGSPKPGSNEDSGRGRNMFSSLWGWATSPPESRESSAHGGGLFSGLKRKGSVGSQLWNWSTAPGSPETLRNRGTGPDLSAFQSATSKPPSRPASPPWQRPASPDETHTDRGV